MENRNYTAVYRIMHWAIALCMLLLLLTIFLRLTWMNKNNVALIIQDYLATTDQKLSQDQMIVLAKKIRKPMWDWHIYFGYALVGLYSLRMLLPAFGKMPIANPFTKTLSSKTKFQYFIYLVFYLFVAASLVTGLLIEWGPKEVKDTVETIHKLSLYYLLAYIVLHIGGVLLAEMTNSKGIVSSIISGTNKAKE